MFFVFRLLLAAFTGWWEAVKKGTNEIFFRLSPSIYSGKHRNEK